MSKIILLGTGGTSNFRINTQKWSYVFAGLLFIIQGVLYLYDNKDGWVYDIVKVAFLFAGVYAIIFAIINFSKSSKFAPKVVVDESFIEFKRGLFKKRKIYKWLDIQAIEFKSFRIDFKTDTAIEVLSYDCTSDISMEIKEAIREIAEKKNIDVAGG